MNEVELVRQAFSVVLVIIVAGLAFAAWIGSDDWRGRS